MKAFSVCIFVSFVLGGCTPNVHYPLEERVYSCPISRYVQAHTVIDASFSSAEERQINVAIDELYRFTSHHVDLLSIYPPDTLLIYRVLSNDPVVVGHDMVQERTSMAWSDNTGIYVVIDRIPPRRLDSVLMHEFGHWAGIRWSDCDGSKFDCDHSPNPQAVMYSEYHGATYYTGADHKMCQSACLCP